MTGVTNSKYPLPVAPLQHNVAARKSAVIHRYAQYDNGQITGAALCNAFIHAKGLLAYERQIMLNAPESDVTCKDCLKRLAALRRRGIVAG